MTASSLLVKDGMVVGLDYTLRLDDGEVIDTSEGRDPLEFMQGQGQIIRGLEQALYGMAVGDEKHVQVAPEDGYGARDPNAFELVPQDIFPTELDLEPGVHLNLRDQSGRVFRVQVAEIREDGVLLDFNHPLAGETLHFDVKIAALRDATPEEMSHGHVHGPGHDH